MTSIPGPGAPLATSRRLWFVNRFFHPDHSATSQIMSDLAFHLAGRGYEVGVITSQGLYGDPAAVLPLRETVNGVTVHRVVRTRHARGGLGGRSLDFLSLYRGFAGAAWRLVQRGDCLVVKTDPPMLSVALAPVVRAKGAVLVNWLQDLYPEVATGLGVGAIAPIAPLLAMARDASLRGAACNVTIGELMSARLVKCGVRQDKIAMISNWCNDEIIRPQATDDNPLRQAWGLRGKFVLGYSGNLGRAHEYATLLEAAQLLRHEAGLVFLFIGGGHQVEKLRADAERLGLAAAFQFRPYQDASLLPHSLTLPDAHWLSLLPAMEGLIVPSKFFGIAAAGRATVAVTDPAGEIAGLLARHDCGVTVAPGAGKALAAAILEMQRNPERLARMGQNARAMLDQLFTKRQAFAHWERVLANAGHAPD